MFSKMLTAGVSPILLWLLIVIYAQQEANVRWNGEMSDNFPIKTLVVKERFLLLSPIVYTVRSYLLRWRGGARVVGFVDTTVVFSDTVMTIGCLLRPGQHCKIWLEHVKNTLGVTTDSNPVKCKTKCLAFLKRKRELPSVNLNGNPLPWVDSLVHLGTRVSSQINGCQQVMITMKVRIATRKVWIMKIMKLLRSLHLTQSLNWDW